MTPRAADLAAFHERSLGPEEVREYLDAPMSEAERDDLWRWSQCR